MATTNYERTMEALRVFNSIINRKNWEMDKMKEMSKELVKGLTEIERTRQMSKENIGVNAKYNRNTISDLDYEKLSIPERREYSDDYGTAQRYQKAEMLAPEGLIVSRCDRKLAIGWARKGVSHQNIIARFEAMKDEELTNEELENEKVKEEINNQNYQELHHEFVFNGIYNDSHTRRT